MSEKELLKLGFTKEYSTDIIEDDPEFYYYVKEGAIVFITNSNDELQGEDWYVEFFNTEIPIRYYEYAPVKMLFDLIEEGLDKTQDYA